MQSSVQLPAGNLQAMMQAVSQQPVAVAIASSSRDMFFYKSGIISSATCGTNVNHAVLMIGYGTDQNTDYWLLKNSWGASWGERGFFRIKRDSTNMCGVLSKYSSYPVVG